MSAPYLRPILGGSKENGEFLECRFLPLCAGGCMDVHAQIGGGPATQQGLRQLALLPATAPGRLLSLVGAAAAALPRPPPGASARAFPAAGGFDLTRYLAPSAPKGVEAVPLLRVLADARFQ